MKASSEEKYQEAIRFYSEVLGLPIVRSWEKGVMIGTDHGVIEIFNNGTEELPQGVIRHFAFAVTDADACVEKVKAAGYTVFDGPRDVVISSTPPYPVRVAFCYGPLGEEIEFFEERTAKEGTAAQEKTDGLAKAGAAAALAAGSAAGAVIAKEHQETGAAAASKSAAAPEAETEDILVIENLCKEYPSFRLDNVSFRVKGGRIMGFIGRNGAGKTTTLKCALGLVKPLSGSIRYFGMEMREHEKEIKQKIGFASGGVDYFNKKKIRDIVKVTKSFYNDWDDTAYREYMNLFELDENKTPAELSAGMKVKLNLVMALSHKAKLLLLDEPTSGLDPVSRDEILTIFKYLRSQGCAIIFSTHVTSDLDKCADDITYIHDGKIVTSTTKDKFISENAEHGSNVEEVMIYFEREGYADKYMV